MRSSRRFACLPFTALAVVLSALTAGAQDPPPRIGPYVVDARGVFPKFPEDAALAESRNLQQAELPGRGLGLDLAGHIYPIRWGAITFGFGAQLLLVRATTDAMSSGDVQLRAVTERLTTFTPQLSFNFGTGNGWSYISGGVGAATWSLVPEGRAPLPVDDESRLTINYGGGARWFATRHLAFAVDARFHVIEAGTPQAGLRQQPQDTIFVIGAGIAIK
jgi:hypothetical protein